jgi:hypothetical protein
LNVEKEESRISRRRKGKLEGGGKKNAQKKEKRISRRRKDE